MKQDQSLGHAFKPWTGLVVGIISVAFVHQFGSDSTFDKCAVVVPGAVFAVATAGFILCTISGIISFRSIKGETNLSRRVVAVISAGCAAFFGFAILLPMIATLVLPPCFQ